MNKLCFRLSVICLVSLTISFNVYGQFEEFDGFGYLDSVPRSSPSRSSYIETPLGLLVLAVSEGIGREPWLIRDGKAQLISDIFPGESSSSFRYRGYKDGKIYFVASRPDEFRALWTYDGESLEQLKDANGDIIDEVYDARLVDEGILITKRIPPTPEDKQVLWLYRNGTMERFYDFADDGLFIDQFMDRGIGNTVYLMNTPDYQSYQLWSVHNGVVSKIEGEALLINDAYRVWEVDDRVYILAGDGGSGELLQLLEITGTNFTLVDEESLPAHFFPGYFSSPYLLMSDQSLPVDAPSFIVHINSSGIERIDTSKLGELHTVFEYRNHYYVQGEQGIFELKGNGVFATNVFDLSDLDSYGLNAYEILKDSSGDNADVVYLIGYNRLNNRDIGPRVLFRLTYDGIEPVLTKSGSFLINDVLSPSQLGYVPTDFIVGSTESGTLVFSETQSGGYGPRIDTASGVIPPSDIASAISGSWYDPASNGAGFMIHAVNDNVAVVYYYGYDADGSRLWLIGVMENGYNWKETTVAQMMNVSGSGFENFDPDQINEVPWGTIEFRLEGCNSGLARLKGDSGQKDFQIIRLGRVAGLDCGKENPPPITAQEVSGSWYEKVTSGQGFSLHMINEKRGVVYFYGYDSDGKDLWLIGTWENGLIYGEEMTIPMLTLSGGTFEEIDPDAITTHNWGELRITFQNCKQASAVLNGTDGMKRLDLQKLANTARISCTE